MSLGGYDTQSIVEIKSSAYVAKGEIYISTGNIYNFYSEFKKCFESLKGEAKLESYEKNLILITSFDMYGHVNIRGEYRRYHGSENQLKFEFATDQTYLSETMSALTNLYKKYGDNMGVLKA